MFHNHHQRILQINLLSSNIIIVLSQYFLTSSYFNTRRDLFRQEKLLEFVIGGGAAIQESLKKPGLLGSKSFSQ